MSYTPTTWAAGDTVTAAKLNKLEQGVASGGVLVVNMSAGTLDKTWEEIADAVPEKPVLIIFVDEVNYSTTVLYVVSVTRASKVGMKYYVKAFTPFIDFASSIVDFTADTSSDYPVVVEEQPGV